MSHKPSRAGWTAAVTRPGGDSGALVTALQALGAAVVEVPLIRFAPPRSDGPVVEALRDFQGWVALSSPQGVRALFELARRTGLGVQDMKFAAVGPSTAEVLLAHGIQPKFLPSKAGARHLGAALPARRGEVVLHLTSPLAQPALQDALEARGIAYRRLELYRTEPADLSPAEQAMLHAADVVTLASGSAAWHLAATLGTEFTVAVMGEQTAQAAREAGFRRISVAREPSVQGLAEAALLAWGGGEP